MVTIDWGQAFQIGGIGFGLVFAVLVILALTMWLVGLLINKFFSRANVAGEQKEGQKN